MVRMACGKSDYKVVGGSMSNVPIMISARKEDMWILTRDYVVGDCPKSSKQSCFQGDGWAYPSKEVSDEFRNFFDLL